MTDARELERTIRKIAEAVDEKAGQIIGLAAIIACLPETANVDMTRVNQVIEQSTRIGFATGQLSSKAKTIVSQVHRLAQETNQAKSDK